ncbi:hypothetical protein C8R44DRAFT_753129 [Mycena epipterygia]|nr:hypothetical protein C8R44DRAFT_753129 [Mycena epipterygia]
MDSGACSEARQGPLCGRELESSEISELRLERDARDKIIWHGCQNQTNNHEGVIEGGGTYRGLGKELPRGGTNGAWGRSRMNNGTMAEDRSHDHVMRATRGSNASIRRVSLLGVVLLSLSLAHALLTEPNYGITENGNFNGTERNKRERTEYTGTLRESNGTELWVREEEDDRRDYVGLSKGADTPDEEQLNGEANKYNTKRLWWYETSEKQVSH